MGGYIPQPPPPWLRYCSTLKNVSEMLILSQIVKTLIHFTVELKYLSEELIGQNAK